MKTLILGGPGCGKTTRLLDIVAQELQDGVQPNQIAFVTFTRAAAQEAQGRAARQFGLDPERDLPWFRTIHSLVYQALGLTRDDVLDAKDWMTFCADVMGGRASAWADAVESEVTIQQESDDLVKLLRMVDLSATMMRSLDDVWHEQGESIGWYKLKQFDAAFHAYKADLGKIDFTDMLLNYIEDGQPVPVKVAVIDEAQDLTAAQWAVVEKAFREADRVYIGGDDDQAIYTWAGADVQKFLTLDVSNRVVLPVSYRLPTSIFNFAQQVVQRIHHRYVKPYHVADDNSAGLVEYHNILDGIDLGPETGTWLVLARNRYLLGKLTQYVRRQGYNYQLRTEPAMRDDEVSAITLWERIRQDPTTPIAPDAARLLSKLADVPRPQLREHEIYTITQLQTLHGLIDQSWDHAFRNIPQGRAELYFFASLNGTIAIEPPRIRLDTIHGVKGMEADNVLLLTDVSQRTLKSYQQQPDSEHRVFYVAVTRARKCLHVVVPQTPSHYPLTGTLLSDAMSLDSSMTE